MGEAILVGRGGAGSDSGSGVQLKTELITSNQTWYVPDAIGGKFYVRIFGGGGAGGFDEDSAHSDRVYRGGGGGGYMANGIFKLNKGETIQISIGEGGLIRQTGGIGRTGGTTSFGSYLSAAGGGGGGIGNNGCSGGNGGSGGGGICYIVSSSSTDLCGGNGIQFGGGGCCGASNEHGSFYYIRGAKGGTWGGNGGARHNTYTAENGTNTMGLLNDPYIEGAGRKGFNPQYYINDANESGSGGYGGNGGSGGRQYLTSPNGRIGYGGGGGYGADGGDGAVLINDDVYPLSSGGGGGYGKTGYGGKGNGYNCGGGGAYGRGGTYGIEEPTYGGGGAGNQNGADGVCIIKYYIKSNEVIF